MNSLFPTVIAWVHLFIIHRKLDDIKKLLKNKQTLKKNHLDDPFDD